MVTKSDARGLLEERAHMARATVRFLNDVPFANAVERDYRAGEGFRTFVHSQERQDTIMIVRRFDRKRGHSTLQLNMKRSQPRSESNRDVCVFREATIDARVPLRNSLVGGSN